VRSDTTIPVCLLKTLLLRQRAFLLVLRDVTRELASITFAILFPLVFAGFMAPQLAAQALPSDEVKPVPLLSGGVGFITTIDGGDPHLGPIVSPVILLPLGKRWLFEARGNFESDLVQVPGENGFRGTVAKSVDYAQLDFIVNRYVTLTAGRFLTPFNIYNERLYPIWIRDLQTDPLILPIGIGPSNASNGGMVRGGFQAHPSFDVNYAVYFSALTTTTAIDSSRLVGGRAGIFVPKTRLEFGGSFQYSLQDEHSSSFGFYAVWEPYALPLEVRGEYARSIQGSGYWGEADYRLSQLPFWRKQMRHTQAVARMQQFFVSASSADSLYPSNMKMFEFGLNYYFIDGFRAASSYGRQFSVDGNSNLWTVGLTYRFVIPLGHAGRN
jgi:hypothetical protein